MTDSNPAVSSSNQGIDALRHPAYWGLSGSAQFELTRHIGGRTAKANAAVPFTIALEFLEQACRVDLAAQESLVAAIFSGVPFEIDDETMVFKLMDAASDGAANPDALRPGRD